MLLRQPLPRLSSFQAFSQAGAPGALQTSAGQRDPWAVHHRRRYYKCYFAGPLNQRARIRLGWAPGILHKVSALTQPCGSLRNLITVSLAIFLLEKLGGRHVPMPFICHVCIAGAATVRETPSPPLILPTPLVIKHGRCWCCQEAPECTFFPSALASLSNAV